jgi:hypothetical protein
MSDDVGEVAELLRALHAEIAKLNDRGALFLTDLGADIAKLKERAAFLAELVEALGDEEEQCRPLVSRQ